MDWISVSMRKLDCAILRTKPKIGLVFDRLYIDLKVELYADFIVSAAAAHRSILVGGGFGEV